MATERNRPSRLTGAVSLMALCILASIATLVPLHGAAAEATLEYEVKAAFLLNFTRFIEWPSAAFADSSSPFTVCILGNDPFGRALDDVVEGEAVGTRKLAIRRISEPPAPRTCQVVFIGMPGKDLPKTLSSLGPGVLTVGDGESFVRQGGIIGFVIDNRRVRFDINQSAAEGAALKLSSKLLSVARSVGK